MTGYDRFDYFLSQWEDLAESAAKNENPAKFILENNGRTIFFMLQGLCKVYKERGKKKRFSKYGDQYKAVEDLLGDMDHYRYCINAFSKEPGVSPELITNFENLYYHADKAANELLQKKKWLNGKRVKKMRKRLSAIKWDKPKKDIAHLAKYYRDEIEEWEVPHRSIFPFTQLEDHLHEYRRRIRWFSIYPHAMRGGIQLRMEEHPNESTLPYLTESVLQSPYNRFPSPVEGAPVLYLNRNRFLALSWLIAFLGDLKDTGILIEELEWACKRLGINEPDGLHQKKLHILQESSAAAEKFIHEGHLQGLIAMVG